MPAIAFSVPHTSGGRTGWRSSKLSRRARVTSFLAGIGDQQQRADAKKVAAMTRRATGKRAKMSKYETK